MTIISMVSRFVRMYILSPEAIVLAVVLIIVYNSATHVRPLWTLVQRAKVQWDLRIREQPLNFYSRRAIDETSNDISETKDQASWELKRDNVAVFAIQGRRPHMEDRFNFVADLEHTGTSIYGIFDGHGGEVI